MSEVNSQFFQSISMLKNAISEQSSHKRKESAILSFSEISFYGNQTHTVIFGLIANKGPVFQTQFYIHM